MSIWDSSPKNTEVLWSHLVSMAEQMRVETYGEVAEAIGLAQGREVAAVGLGPALDFIRDEICFERGLPLLNAIAVNSHTWRPGESFLPPGMCFGPSEDHIWRAVVAAAFSYPWHTVELD